VRIRFEVSFSQPVERVFPLLVDPSTWGSWSPAVVERRRIGEGPIAPGARWASIDKVGPFRIHFSDELVELEPDRRVVFRHSAPWDGRTEFACEERQGATLVRATFDARPGGLLAPLRLLPDSLASRVWKSDFERLEAVVTGTGPRPAGSAGASRSSQPPPASPHSSAVPGLTSGAAEGERRP
jgi:uncharacterized protein YndB with AHSA1/START domain